MRNADEMTRIKDQLRRCYVHGEAVDAVEVTAALAAEIADWCDGFVVEIWYPETCDESCIAVCVPSNDGLLRAAPGDYIAQKQFGEFIVMPSRYLDNVQDFKETT